MSKTECNYHLNQSECGDVCTTDRSWHYVVSEASGPAPYYTDIKPVANQTCLNMTYIYICTHILYTYIYIL